MLFEMEGVLGFILLALWIWAIVDCITSDSSIIRNLPKGVWLILIIVRQRRAWCWSSSMSRWKSATTSCGRSPSRSVAPTGSPRPAR